MKPNDLKNIQKIIFVSSIILIINGIIEISVGFLSHSIGLIADGIDSIGNSTISFIVWIGVSISRKKPDKKFHFGYYRVETLASLIAAIIMVSMSIVIFYNAYMRLINPVEYRHPFVAILTVIGVGISTTLITVTKNKLAAKHKLLSLRVDAKNSIKDAAGSFIILISFLLSYMWFPWMDSLGAMIIGVFIFSYGIVMTKEATLILVDAFHNPELVEDIKKIVNQHPMIKLKYIRLRNSGNFIIGEIYIKVNKRISVGKLISIKKQVRKKIMEEIEGIKDLIISADA